MMTKELVSAVLRTNCTHIGAVQLGYQFYVISDRSHMNKIHVFEFMKECKLWALDNGFSLETRPYNDYGKIDWHIAAWEIETGKQHLFDLQITETGAVNTACIWIMEQKSKETK